MGYPRAFQRPFLALTTTAALVAAVFVGTAAHADTAPVDPATPRTVAADALPAPQINGVVWAQLIVGNTVYVGGEFTRARPAGSAAGVNEVVRNNLMAYNITTGAMTSWNPSANGAVRALVASPDGARVFAGGTFTTVGGATRYRLAAFDTATGALSGAWTPTVNAGVRALAVSGAKVYAGGSFSVANGQARSRIAAFAVTNGALQAWSGNPDAGSVSAIAASPDGTKVIIGGSFTSYNGSDNPGYGIAATDATTGASLPWKMNSTIRDAGTKGAILSLTSSAEGAFGTGYAFGDGANFEGTFRADWSDGSLIWLEDCHGDTYSAVPAGDVVYTTGHAHYCGNIGGFGQTNPWTYHRTLTFTMAATGTVTRDTMGYPNFEGNPRPSLLAFYPDINTGTYTGQGQGPWNVAANDKYVLYGGEFTIVNNKGQQGLSRFAVSSIAPNKQGPRVAGADFVPSVASYIAGSARLSWRANYDRDNEHLTYTILRNGVAVKTMEADSVDWNRPAMSWTDTGLTPGASYSYRIRVADPFGNTVTGNAASVTVAAEGSMSDYAKTVLADSPRSYWPLGEPQGAMAFDWAGGYDAMTNAGVSRNAPGAIVGDAGTSSRFDGSANGYAATLTQEPSTDTFSVETWVRTTTTTGGKIVGFGDSAAGNSSSYDRHLYMDDGGRIWFGVYPGGVRTLNTTGSFNDGAWHHIVGTLGTGGMSLFVDGKRVGLRTDTTNAQPYSGYWRIGGDNLGGWPNQPTSTHLAGDIDEVAVYPAALSSRQVVDHYVASGRTSPIVAAPADAYGRAVYEEDPDLYWRLAEPSGTTAADSSATGTTGTYAGSLTQGTPGLLAQTTNPAVAFDAGTVISDTPVNDPRTYSLEAWFSTTTTRGGKLIGFGNQRTGLSNNYDRHVYMQDDGRLVFGTWTGQTNTITSAGAFNDGRPHHVVAMQSGDGMRMYVDGSLVGTNPQTGAEGYAGYWRIGGDVTWGSTSPYFAGTLDEVAVYSHPLTASTVASHYALGASATPANTAPAAAFTDTEAGLVLSVDGSTSTDADGTIVSYAWDFGDGATATGKTASHSYAAAGTYPVSLTVTDNGGAHDTVTRSATVASPPPANQPPTASFTSTSTDLTLTTDASASSDPDGTVSAYAWDFGDGATAAGAKATHTFAAAGTYTVTLTVTDNSGAVGSSTKATTVTGPAAEAVLAKDAFERTRTGGLGTADVGGAWTTTGSSTNYSVANGVGALRSATAGAMENAYLRSVSSSATDARMTFAVQQAPTGSGAYVSLLGRASATDDYRARVRLNADGSVVLQVMRGATSLKSMTVPGLTYSPGDRLNLRVAVFGTNPTTIEAMTWRTGDPEPAQWQLSATDTTPALQVAGGIGVSFYLGGTATVVPVTVSIDDLIATAKP